jgi:S-disulfanyl-L-cysteine oxidoreductase SoxD
MAVAKKSRTAALVVAGAVAAAVVGAAMFRDADLGAAAAVRLRPDDASVLALGQRVYATQCAACHGARLEGQANWRQRGPDGKLPAPPHDASGHTWHHPDELLFRITKHGVAKAANLKDHVSAMPAYEGVLSDEEIVAALSWIKAQWPAGIRARHDELNRSAGR